MNTGGADERIALQITSTADVTGVRQMRTETTSLADAAVKASNEVTGAQGKLAQAAKAATVDQTKLVATVEQTREAWARAGNDMGVFARELAVLVQGQNKLAAATDESTKALERQGKATVGSVQLGPSLARVAGGSIQGPALPASFGPQLGPAFAGPSRIGPQLGPALPDTRLAVETAKSAAALDKVNPKIRTAGNALNMLAVSAANGTGSMAGLTMALGNVAQGVTAMSTNAKVAASSAGIGALAAAVAALIALSIDAAAKLKEIPEGKLSGAIDAHLKNLHDEQSVTSELAALDARRAAMQDAALTKTQKARHVAFDADMGKQALEDDAKRLQAIVDLDAARTALLARGRQVVDEDRARGLRGIAIEVEAQTTAAGRYAARHRQIEAERLEAVRTHELTEEAANRRAVAQRRDLDKEAADYRFTLEAATVTAWGALNQDVYDQRRTAEDAALAKEKMALNARTLSAAQYKHDLDEINARHQLAIDLIERERTAAIAGSSAARAAASEDPRVADAGRRLAIEEERKADERRLGAKEAQLNAEKKLLELEKRRRDEGLAGYGKLASAVKNHGTLVGAIAKASADAVSLYEIAKKGKSAAISAKMEWSAAMGAFGTGNAVGGALHLAAAGGYAAAALAAGAEAAGVVSGGGGAGGGANGGNGDSGTFQPRNGNGGGDQVIVFQSIDPYSREKINEVRYLIGRSGTLKRPIQLPPTTGLERVA